MPKDDWKSARDKDTGRRAKRAKRDASRSTKKRLNDQQIAVMAKRICQPETALWFGKYKGIRICDLPESYRRWLAQLQPTPGPMTHLVHYLRSYRPPVTPAKGGTVQSCAGSHTPRPLGTADKRSTTNPKGGIPSGGV
jgi:uncharacterized protein (DUF3820 family)